MEKLIKEICISQNGTLLDALRQMDRLARKLLIVVDDNDKYVSMISIGDIQRSIIANMELTNQIFKVVNKVDKIVAKPEDDLVAIKEKMFAIRAEFMPVVSKERTIKKVIFWSELFQVKERITADLSLPVVIMAGGKGSRLKPITNVLPKPLIPIGEKTILEEIMDRFVSAGCNRFLVSVNYKAEMIKHYFETLNHPDYRIEYFQEGKPLGTAGSMYLLKGKINTTFFVSNCDILIDQYLDDICQYHKVNKNAITIVSALKHYRIPYGTIKTGENGALLSFSEKPELSFQINTGMYLLEPEILGEIPNNQFFHITDLIEKVKKSGRDVGVFPISEGSWKDIGEWSEYNKVIKRNA